MADKKPDKDLSDKVKDALGALTLGNQKKQQKDKYAFWGTQPVVQFSDASTSEVVFLANCTDTAPQNKETRY